MELHKSGTKILGRYIETYFHTFVQPPVDGSNQAQGVVEIKAAAFRTWKHTTPHSHLPLRIPQPDATQPLTLLLTVRDVVPWMQSLSKHAYELFPVPLQRRRYLDIEWMLGSVEFDTVPSYHHNPRPNDSYKSVPALWELYMKGYLSGRVTPKDHPHRVVIVRHEDIAQHPAAVVHALAQLGLPRNDAAFQVIEEDVTDATKSRSDIVQNLRSMKQADIVPRIISHLSPEGRALRHFLGYV